jgi:hypothetical protein
MKSHEFIRENTDDELFGSDADGTKAIVYRTGKKMLTRLENSYKEPAVRYEYNQYLEANDVDALFSLVTRLTGVKFKQAFVIDTILREFAGSEGLNDFGWMLVSGEFQDLLNAWERFREDTDIEQEDWFQREVQDFKGIK